MAVAKIEVGGELRYYFAASAKKQAEILYLALLHMEKNEGLVNSQGAIIAAVQKITTFL